MRKLKLQMQMTVNGYVGGPNGEADWMTWNPDEEFTAFLGSLLGESDTLLLGYKSAAGGFLKFWEDTAATNPAHPFAKKITAIPKIVFSRTQKEFSWDHTRLAAGNLKEEIAALKRQEGKDLIVFGGAGFVSSLIAENLIDEYHLIINPTAIGNGMTIFGDVDGVRKFTPVRSKLFPGGKTVLSFEPQR